VGLSITSIAFAANGAIPRFIPAKATTSRASCLDGAPANTRSYVLIVDDPDAPDPAAPKMTWVHWVLYNIPATAGACRRP